MSSSTIQLVVNEACHGARLDKCLAEMMPEQSRSWHQKQIKEGAVRYNGALCTAGRTAVTLGSTIEIDYVPPAPPDLIGEDIDLSIIYEDEYMLVIDKPAGMVVHPAAGNWSGTVVNALLGRDPNFGKGMNMADMRPGIVHRLDKDTSGLLVIAKTKAALRALCRAFAERRTKKIYAALVYGVPKRDHERIETFIGRHPGNRKKMAVVDRNGRFAISEYDVEEVGKINAVAVSFLSVNILTGRTHQIRVHMAHCKTPIVGDLVYGGNPRLEAGRQMLHAWKLKVPHPITGRMMKFKAPLPDDFEALRAQMEPLMNQPISRRLKHLALDEEDGEDDVFENYMVEEGDEDFDAADFEDCDDDEDFEFDEDDDFDEDMEDDEL